MAPCIVESWQLHLKGSMTDIFFPCLHMLYQLLLYHRSGPFPNVWLDIMKVIPGIPSNMIPMRANASPKPLWLGPANVIASHRH